MSVSKNIRERVRKLLEIGIVDIVKVITALVVTK